MHLLISAFFISVKDSVVCGPYPYLAMGTVTPTTDMWDVDTRDTQDANTAGVRDTVRDQDMATQGNAVTSALASCYPGYSFISGHDQHVFTCDSRQRAWNVESFDACLGTYTLTHATFSK